MIKGSTIMFYLLAALILVCGLLAVTTRKIFRAAIYLLFSLVGIAGLYLWMHYPFIAAVQIVVYVGGIVVLILFSIFLTQQAGEDLPSPSRRSAFWAALASVSGLGLVLVQLFRSWVSPAVLARDEPEMEQIGSQMMDTRHQGYALPFEVVSILLLAAMIGCIVIALRSRTTGSGTARGAIENSKEPENPA